jgi:hypothetical protein
VERLLLLGERMRFLFHAMLGISVAVVATGVVMGAGVRLGTLDDDPGGSASALPLHRAARERLPVEQTIAPPVPVSPRYAAEVTGAPVLAWRLEEGTDGARVELCPTNDFDVATTRRIDVVGEKVQLPAPWPHGVWYWHLRGRHRAYVGDRATPTWMLYVGDGASASAEGPGGIGPLALHVGHGPSPWAVQHDPPPGTLLPVYDLRVVEGSKEGDGPVETTDQATQ